MITLDVAKKLVEKKRLKLQVSQEKKLDLRKELKGLRRDMEDLETCKSIVNELGIVVQEDIRRCIETLVTQALQSVMGEEYSFVVKNEISRGTAETFFYVMDHGKLRTPEGSLGGTVIDIVSFALRLVVWSIMMDRTRPLMILDEPFRNVDKTVHMEKCGVMVKELSEMLGLQFIFVSHEVGLSEVAADSCYEVTRKNRVSTVRRIR